MRLRVLVRRHNLPDTAVVWAVEALDGLTVSQLLEQVNEVIPLESDGEWGLEDYVLEVKGSASNYECLHFQPIHSVLHDEDEIIIRPLLTQDLKQRRISGRHQITSDGRHLFDGFVFGRPRRRDSTDRPSITIPPRKRRRIDYNEEVDGLDEDETLGIDGVGLIDGIDTGNHQIVVRADFEDEDDEDEDDDEDFEPGDDNDESGEESIEDADSLHEVGGDVEDDETNPFGMEEEGLDLQTKVEALQDAFPTVPGSVCKRVLESCEGDLAESWDSLNSTFKATIPRKVVLSPAQTISPRKTRSERKREAQQDLSSIDEQEPPENVSEEFEGFDDEYETSFLNYYDQHGLPEGTITNGKSLKAMATIAAGNTTIPSAVSQTTSGLSRSSSHSKSVRFVEQSLVTPSTLNNVDLEEDNDEEDDDFESEMSSGDSTDDESSTSEESSGSSALSDELNSISTSGHDNDDDSSEVSSDSEPEEASSKPSQNETIQNQSRPSAFEDNPKPAQTVRPGQGKSSTKARNERRRLSNALQRYKAKGILPAETTISELKQLDMTAIESLQAAEEALALINNSDISQATDTIPIGNNSKSSEFEGKRQELLASIASGGVEVPLTSSRTVSEQNHMETSELETPGAVRKETETPVSQMDLRAAAETDIREAQTETSDVPIDNATPRRRKLDLGAGRRLLFGALGIKTPKTKLDEDQVRKDLMKYARPLRTGPTGNDDISAIGDKEADNEDPEAWRDKIILRAVECCYDGVELSEPPFPFVQRWDPQQQGGFFSKTRRGGKNKRRQRNQSQYYEDESQPSAKKQKRDYQGADNAEAIEGELDSQLMADIQGATYAHSYHVEDVEDLPKPPDDVSTLPDLQLHDVTAGAIITFQQLILSESTNWQPTISPYRTATVTSAEADTLVLKLARRDREDRGKYYDEETGERVYGKFDMPDEDELEEAEDDGIRTINFSELIGPKVVHVATEASLNASSTEATVQDKANISTDDSTTLGHEETTELFQEKSTDASQALSHADAMKDVEVVPLSSHARTDMQTPVSETPDRYPSNSTQQKALEIIKEAGFRSSPPSSLIKLRSLQSDDPPEDAPSNRLVDDLNDSNYDDGVDSPQFNGFDSSPKSIVEERDNSSLHDGALEDQVSNATAIFDTPTVSYPKLSVPSSIASQTTDHGHQPDFPTPGEDTLQEFDYDSFLHGGDDDPISGPPSLPKPWDPKTEHSTKESDVKEENSFVDIPSSDPNLPTLEEVFSTAGSSVVPKQEKTMLRQLSDISEADREYQDAMEALDAQMDDLDDPDQLPPLLSENGQRHPFSLPPGSQQIDLTISSDVEPSLGRGSEGNESYDDSYGLPRGSGWVEKKRRTRGRRKTASQESSLSVSSNTRTRSARRTTSHV